MALLLWLKSQQRLPAAVVARDDTATAASILGCTRTTSRNCRLNAALASAPPHYQHHCYHLAEARTLLQQQCSLKSIRPSCVVVAGRTGGLFRLVILVLQVVSTAMPMIAVWRPWIFRGCRLSDLSRNIRHHWQQFYRRSTRASRAAIRSGTSDRRHAAG